MLKHRKLVFDSIFEFANNNKFIDIINKYENNFFSNNELKSLFEKYTKRNIFNFYLFFLIFILVFFINTVIIKNYIYNTYNKFNYIKFYLFNEFNIFFPDYYIQNKDLYIDLNDYINYPPLKLYLPELDLTINPSYLSNNYYFIIKAEYLNRKSLNINLKMNVFGIERKIINKTIYATSKLLPIHLEISVSYPKALIQLKEKYSSLQDIEVYENANIKLSGYFTKDISNIYISNPNIYSSYISNNNFEINLFPQNSILLSSIKFYSYDSDIYVLPDFYIRIITNYEPSLKLLFPLQDIYIRYYNWNLNSIVEAEDDQGLYNFKCVIVISNKNINLSKYTEKKEYIIHLNNEKFLREKFQFSYKDIELYPEDVASITIFARDIFGKYSLPVSFNIIIPDLLSISEERDREISNIRQNIKNISNYQENIIKNLKEKDLSGYNHEVTKLEKSVSNIQESVSKLSDTKINPIDEISDLKESLEQIKKLTDNLLKYQQDLKDISKVWEKNIERLDKIDLNKIRTQDLLKQMESLLKNIEYYKNISDLINQFKTIKNLFESLKEQTNSFQFSKNLESYKNELKKLLNISPEKFSQKIEKLMRDSSNLKMNDPKSFEYSEDLLSQLENELNNEIFQSFKNNIASKIKNIDFLLEEIYLNIIFIKSINKNYGLNKTKVDIAELNKLVELINSINSSFKFIQKEYNNVVEGIFIDLTFKKNIDTLLSQINNNINYIITELRDNQLEFVYDELSYLEKNFSILFLYFLSLNNGLSKSIDQKQNMGLDQKMLSISLEDLMRMQATISKSLEEILKQLSSSGELSEEMKNMMKKLSELQSEILKNFQEMMRKEDSGLFSGGSDISKNMEDIIKDLDSYKVNKDTLDKSKKIEEKLLDSKKAIQSKGVSQERKAETAKTYEIIPPKSIILEKIEKFQLENLTNKAMSDYYKKLIKKYLKGK